MKLCGLRAPISRVTVDNLQQQMCPPDWHSRAPLFCLNIVMDAAGSLNARVAGVDLSAVAAFSTAQVGVEASRSIPCAWPGLLVPCSWHTMAFRSPGLTWQATGGPSPDSW